MIKEKLMFHWKATAKKNKPHFVTVIIANAIAQ